MMGPPGVNSVRERSVRSGEQKDLLWAHSLEGSVNEGAVRALPQTGFCPC